MITLERAYIPDGSATLGKWTLPGGWSCYTLELPWRSNARSHSCIPEGVYDMALRESPVVRRTSRGAFRQGWEIVGVPGRDHIMVHVGNYIRNTEGCPLVGRRFHWHHEYGPMVTDSQDVFVEFMGRMAKRDAWRVDIHSITRAFP